METSMVGKSKSAGTRNEVWTDSNEGRKKCVPRSRGNNPISYTVILIQADEAICTSEFFSSSVRLRPKELSLRRIKTN